MKTGVFAALAIVSFALLLAGPISTRAIAQEPGEEGEADSTEEFQGQSADEMEYTADDEGDAFAEEGDAFAEEGDAGDAVTDATEAAGEEDAPADADAAFEDDAAIAEEAPEGPVEGVGDEDYLEAPQGPPASREAPASPAEPAVPAPAAPVAGPVRVSVETTPLGDLVKNPAAKAILERFLPQMPQFYDQTGTMTLAQIAPMSQGALDDERLRQLQAEFDKLAP